MSVFGRNARVEIVAFFVVLDLPLLLKLQLYLKSMAPSIACAYVILMDRGLAFSAVGMNNSKTPSRYSALMPSGSISTGTVKVRSNSPETRSRR